MKLSRLDFVPNGYQRVDPAGAVTMLLHPDDLSAFIGKGFMEINTNVCNYQPFFASAAAAEPWLAARPGSRVFTVSEMFERSWYIHYRDHFRPRIHAPSRT